MKEVGPVVYLAIDPSILASAVAWCVEGGPITAKAAGKIENLGQSPHLARVRDLQPSKVYVVLEYPTFALHGSDCVRAAANTWMRVIRKFLPHRTVVKRVSPATWQAAMFKNLPEDVKSKKSKVKSLHLCNERFGIATKDDNVADAVCLLHYLMAAPPKSGSKESASRRKSKTAKKSLPSSPH